MEYYSLKSGQQQIVEAFKKTGSMSDLMSLFTDQSISFVEFIVCRNYKLNGLLEITSEGLLQNFMQRDERSGTKNSLQELFNSTLNTINNVLPCNFYLNVHFFLYNRSFIIVSCLWVVASIELFCFC
jgi:hypothetical protein